MILDKDQSKCDKTLVIAVIGQAVEDYIKGKKEFVNYYPPDDYDRNDVKKIERWYYYLDAQKFLFSKRLDDFIEKFSVKLVPEVIRKQVAVMKKPIKITDLETKMDIEEDLDEPLDR
jgi:hypothetical protein